MVRRGAVSLLLLVSWFALGTGLLAHLHNLQHASEHHAAPYRQDENNCRVHAQLHTPALVGATDAGVTTAAPLNFGAVGLAPQISSLLARTPCGSRDPPLT